MKKSIIYHGLGVGFARGGPLLALPFLTIGLTLAELGQFYLIQSMIPLISIFILGNTPAAVFREGVSSQKSVNTIIRSTVPFSFLVFFLGFLGLIIFPNNSTIGIISYVVILIAANGNHEMLISGFRARSQYKHYLALSILRSVALVSAGLFVILLKGDLNSLLLIYASIFGSLSFFFSGLYFDYKVQTLKRKEWFTLLTYTLPLLPYTIGQWVMVSSNRYLIAYQISDEAAGLYSIAFLVASPIVLLYGIIGMVCGKDILERYSRWDNKFFRTKSILIFIGCFFVCMATSLLLFYLDKEYWGFLKNYDDAMVPTIIFITGSFFPLLANAIYGNILFYHRRTGLLALSTAISGVINVVLTFYFIPKVGIVGAAMAAMVANAIYSFLTCFWSGRITKRLNKGFTDELMLLSSIALIFSIMFYFKNFFIGLI